jgi:hypothetical protein
MGGGQPDGGDPCAMATDCSTCVDPMSCFGCNMTKYAAGVDAYNVMLDCINCTACYTTCGGAATCTKPPPMMDPCDTGMCPACGQCSTSSGGTCVTQRLACTNDTACNALMMGLVACPR